MAEDGIAGGLFEGTGKAGEFLHKHWAYILIGLGGVVVVYYIFAKTTGAAATAQVAGSGDVPPNAAALQGLQISNQGATTRAGIAAATTDQQIAAAQTIAGIQAAAGVQALQIQAENAQAIASITANENAYVTNVNDTLALDQYGLAASVSQTNQANLDLTNGFINFATDTASEASSIGSSTANIASANDMSAARTIQATLQGVAQIIGAAEGGSLLGSLSGSAGSLFSGLPTSSAATVTPAGGALGVSGGFAPGSVAGMANAGTA